MYAAKRMTWLLVSLLVLSALPAMAQTGEAPGGVGSAGADRDWRFVERLKADGMFDVAARQLEAFAADHPNDARAPGALLEAATLYRRMEQSVAALGAYDRLLERFPTSEVAPQALLDKAELLAESGRHEDAAETCRSLLASFPASPQADQARLGLGEATMAMGQNDEAGRLFRYLIGGRAAAPIAARAMFDLGALSHRAGEDSLAIHYFDAVSQRYPGEVVGAFGLLRAAELLADREAPGAARERYQTVLKRYTDPYLQARANLGLAHLDEADGEYERAAKSYREVAERGGSPEQVQEALLGLGTSSYRAGKYKDAESAADAYLEKYPDAAGVPWARLTRAQSRAARGEDDATAELEAIASGAPGAVPYQAMATLARMEEPEVDAKPDDEGRFHAGCVSSRDRWRAAAQLAPDRDRAAGALVQAARITGVRLNRPRLAAEYYVEAARVAESPALEAAALGAAVQSYYSVDDRAHALATADRLVAEHPLSQEAVEARWTERLYARRAQGDPDRASSELAELALRRRDDAEVRRLQVGRIVRDVQGDPAAAAEIFEPLAKDGSTPELAAQASFELGKSREAEALEAYIASPTTDAWKAPWRSARASYVQGASQAAAEVAAALSRVALIRLEVAEAALPQNPPLFDADTSPLFEGVGELETVQLGSATFLKLAGSARGALEATTNRDDRAWLLWRTAELSTDVEIEQRIAWAKAGLEEASQTSHEMGLRYCLGQLYLRNDDAEEAARELRTVMQNPQSGDLSVAARYAMAEIHRGERRYDSARELYEDYASAFPGSQRGQRSLLLAGDCALYAGDAERAAHDYRTILDRYPDGVYTDDATYRLATAQQRLGRTEAARANYLQLAEDNRSTRYAGRSLLKLADLESRAGHDSAAVDALTRLVAVDSDLAAKEGVRLRLAELEIERGEGAAAMRWVDGAAEDGEETAQIVSLRSRAYAASDRTDKAEEELLRLTEGYPDAAELTAVARIQLADAQLEAGDTDAALASYERAESESRDPALRARAAYGHGMALAKAQRFDESLSDFRRVVRNDSEGDWAAEALYKIGGISDRMGEDESARDAFLALADDHPRHALAPMALRGAAVSNRRLNRFDKALEIYHRLLEEYPEAPGGEDVLSNIAYCYHEMGRYEVCIAAYERVIPLLDEEGQAYAQFWIADSYEKLGRFEQAAAAYLKIPYLYPDQDQLPVTAQLKAAGVYEQMGQPDAAGRLYQKVIRSHGANSQWGAEAAKRLDRLGGESDASS